MRDSYYNLGTKDLTTSARFPPVMLVVDNGVVILQALFVLIAPLLSFSKGQTYIMDRAMDGLFAIYLAVVVLKCLIGKPTFRLIAGLLLVGIYGGAGIVESYMIDNLSGFIFEAKMLVSLALLICLLDHKPQITRKTLQILFCSFIVASCMFMVLLPGERLHLVNESNYLCLYIGITMFSYLSWKGKAVTVRFLIGLGLFTLFLIITTQSRTGAGFMALTWIIYLWERFGFGTAVISSFILGSLAVVASVLAIALKMPIVERFEELKNPRKVDRFIYFEEASKIMKRRPVTQNIVRLSYAEPVSTRVNENMKWLTTKGKHGTGVGELYPHHFHLAYLRILIGHGFVPFFLYLIAIPLIWRVNKYLAIGIAICSISMSVPYLSLFFGALHLSMAFRN